MSGKPTLLKLEHWLATVRERAGGDLLIVQTLRNAIMVASVLASAALIAFMGTLATAQQHPRGTLFAAIICLVISLALAVEALLKLARAGFELQHLNASPSPSARDIHSSLRFLLGSGACLSTALLLIAVGLGWRMLT